MTFKRPITYNGTGVIDAEKNVIAHTYEEYVAVRIADALNYVPHEPAEVVINALRELAEGYFYDPTGQKQPLTIHGKLERESIIAKALSAPSHVEPTTLVLEQSSLTGHGEPKHPYPQTYEAPANWQNRLGPWKDISEWVHSLVAENDRLKGVASSATERSLLREVRPYLDLIAPSVSKERPLVMVQTKCDAEWLAKRIDEFLGGQQ